VKDLRSDYIAADSRSGSVSEENQCPALLAEVREGKKGRALKGNETQTLCRSLQTEAGDDQLRRTAKRQAPAAPLSCSSEGSMRLGQEEKQEHSPVTRKGYGHIGR